MLSADYTDFSRLDNRKSNVAHVKEVLEELGQNEDGCRGAKQFCQRMHHDRF